MVIKFDSLIPVYWSFFSFAPFALKKPGKLSQGNITSSKVSFTWWCWPDLLGNHKKESDVHKYVRYVSAGIRLMNVRNVKHPNSQLSCITGKHSPTHRNSPIMGLKLVKNKKKSNVLKELVGPVAAPSRSHVSSARARTYIYTHTHSRRETDILLPPAWPGAARRSFAGWPQRKTESTIK